MFLAALFHTAPHWKPHRRPASPITCSCRRGSGGGPLCKSGRQMAPNDRRGGVSGREPGHQPARVHSLSPPPGQVSRSEEHTSELQSRQYLVCRLLLEKKKTPPHFVLYSVRS